ncbi:MAG: hypothetical protein JSV62_09800 [Promethearchaeota archaeon]|nr:MAG: hypothetical protein JSV62_09800 [Candidatus Lokiarchaeota archaeon]
MVWGGSLNKKGSDHIRKLREVEKIIKFLEEIKKDLNHEEEEIISKSIDIITEYITKSSEQKD